MIPNQISEIDVVDIGNGNTEIVINTDEKTEALLVKNKNGLTAEIKKILKIREKQTIPLILKMILSLKFGYD